MKTLHYLEGICSIVYGPGTTLKPDNALLLPSLACTEHFATVFFPSSFPAAVFTFIFVILTFSINEYHRHQQRQMAVPIRWASAWTMLSSAEFTSWWRKLIPVTCGIKCPVETCILWAMWGTDRPCVGSAVVLHANWEGSACLSLLLLGFLLYSRSEYSMIAVRFLYLCELWTSPQGCIFNLI